MSGLNTPEKPENTSSISLFLQGGYFHTPLIIFEASTGLYNRENASAAPPLYFLPEHMNIFQNAVCNTSFLIYFCMGGRRRFNLLRRILRLRRPRGSAPLETPYSHKGV
jgi:hypothetical protein